MICRRLALAVLLLSCATLLACGGARMTEVAADADQDGVADSVDNCPGAWNPAQDDADGDGCGDGCECDGAGADRDGDGIVDTQDNCVGSANPDQHDSDADGLGDPCDF